MTDWKNLVMGVLTLALIIFVVMWFMGWGTASVATKATIDITKPVASATVSASADSAKDSAPAPQSSPAAAQQNPQMGQQLPQQGLPMQQQAQVAPPAQMGQLPQPQEQEVYNPALVPVVPPPAPPPGSVPTAKKEWEVSRDMLFVQLTDQQAPRETRVRAGRALGSFPTAGVSHVLETVLLNDKDPVVRYTAAQALGLTGSGMNCAGLSRSIQMDPDSQVRQMAERSLGMINARKGMPPQKALIFQRDRNNQPAPDQPTPIPRNQQPTAPPVSQEPTLAPTSPSAALSPDGQDWQQADGSWGPTT